MIVGKEYICPGMLRNMLLEYCLRRNGKPTQKFLLWDHADTSPVAFLARDLM